MSVTTLSAFAGLVLHALTLLSFVYRYISGRNFLLVEKRKHHRQQLT
jgi:hypothetical protein